MGVSFPLLALCNGAPRVARMLCGLLIAIGVLGGAHSVAAPPLQPTLRERLAGLRVVAHRGGRGFYDSNTIARFEKTRQQGVDAIETDLRLSADGVPFLFHNRTLGHTTNCQGPIDALPAAAIERCQLKGLGQSPDTFEEALRWSAGRVVLNVEFKTLASIAPAIELVRKYDAYEWVIFQVQSRSAAYQIARSQDPRVALLAAPRGPNADAQLADLLALHDEQLVVIELHPELLTRENLERIRSAGKLASINAWYLGRERTSALGIWPFVRVAACTQAFASGVTIAVTNVPEDCLRQRDRFASDAARASVAGSSAVRGGTATSAGELR
jgi:glycerophosphoryl diester phosphodiesterase